MGYPRRLSRIVSELVSLSDSLFSILTPCRRDAIVQSFALNSTQFQPVYAENEREILVIAFSPDSTEKDPQITGFIRFAKGQGCVTIANANFQLQPKHLQLGQTFKEYNSGELIGCHGEGLALAAMVMSRAGYKIRIESSSHGFSFSFKEPRQTGFFYTITTTKKDLYRSEVLEAKPYLTKCQSRIWKHVAITVGPVRGAPESKIEVHEFYRWLRVFIDIYGFSKPSDMVEAQRGDLILDSHHANKIYLKGLLFPDPTSEIDELKYGLTFTMECLAATDST